MLPSKNFVNSTKKRAIKNSIFLPRKEVSLLKLINRSVWDLPSPSTITYFWNLGATLGLCLVTQLLTGLFLRFHYRSEARESFSSIVLIIKEVWAGWLIRFVHINGASLFFFIAYLHMFRGLFFMRATHKKVWNRGVAILIILMGISFIGYVLPWGQMSYWAVAVITNLLSVIPIVGERLVTWVWGDYSVRAPTLNRFYSLHFFLPFVLAFFVLLHLVFLHENGSRNSLGLERNMDKLSFHPYFSVKDFFFILSVFVATFIISFFTPYIFGDAINNVPANPMQTPVHIQPEWYFLPSYAILRALPRKSAGVIALVLSVRVFFVLPLFKIKFARKFSNLRECIFWVVVVAFAVLIVLGASPAVEPYISIRKLWSMIYFSRILLLNA